MTHESAEKQARQLEKKLAVDVHTDWLKTRVEYMREYLVQENALLKALRAPAPSHSHVPQQAYWNVSSYEDMPPSHSHGVAGETGGFLVDFEGSAEPSINIAVGGRVADFIIFDEAISFTSGRQVDKDRLLLLCGIS